jgi:tetratricopeptide (TPR) repeat protein
MKRIDYQTLLLFVITLLLAPGAYEALQSVRADGALSRTAEKLADYGDKSIEDGAYERAVVALQRAVQLRPGAVDLRRRLVLAQARLTAEQPSALTKEGALGLEMDLDMTGIDLASSAPLGVAYAQVELLQGRVGDAHARLETVSSAFPQSALAQHGVGKSRALRGTPELAIDPLSKAVSLDPKNARYRRSLGLALVKAKKWARAEEELARAVEAAPDGQLYWRLGEARLELERFDTAAEALQYAVNGLSSGRSRTLARAQLGFALHRLGRNYEAIRELRLAYEQMPTPTILHNLGIAHQAVDNHPKAADLFRRALAGDPLNGDGHVRLVRSLMALGQKPLAERVLSRLESLARTHGALKEAERVSKALIEKG